MSHGALRMAWLLTVLPALSGCGAIVGVPPPAESWPTYEAPPPREVVRPPEVRFQVPALIANDPEAQRFLLLKQLVEAGLVPPDEAETRRTANIGALLPYSAPPPAQGLARPAALRDIADRLALLSVTPALPPAVRKAERDFLMDTLLPAEPARRTGPARQDAQALASGRKRVEDLGRMGLVEHDEFQREMAAILARQQDLAKAPPPPPPAKKKPVRKKPPAGSIAGETPKPGDVPGGVQPTVGKGPRGLHLLSMASPTMTDKAVEALKKEFPELAALEFKAVKTDIPDLGTTWRLIAGPMPPSDADSLCAALRGKGQSCAPADF